jgi:Holliday junction resolvase RusA-like endonuclease
MGIDGRIENWPAFVMWEQTIAKFTVSGEPTSKKRHRTTTKDGETVSYTPAETKAAEEAIQAEYINGYRTPVDDPNARLGVRISFYRKSRVHRDVDNMAKLILDALNKLAWDDDSQIDELILRRTDDKENPRAEVLVYVL